MTTPTTNETIVDLREGASQTRRRRAVPTLSTRIAVVNRRPAPLGRRKLLVPRVRQNATSLRRLDLVLFATALALSIAGALLVWSATRVKLLTAGDDPQAFVVKHLLNVIVGLGLAWIVWRIDYRTLRAYTPVVYGVTLLSLLAVLTPLGTSLNGAHAWIELPAGFTFQPSEFAKITIILAMAMVLSQRDVGSAGLPAVDVRYALVWALAPVSLIMLQPDLGTVLIIGSVVVGILAAAGASARWIIGLVSGALAGAAGAIMLGVLSKYQIDRLLAFVNPSQDPQGIGYNVAQARIAIGNGGWFGAGLFNGHQTQGAFVPYQQTDFVFSVAGEELGLVGAGLLIIVIGALLWRGVRIARAAGDPFGRLVATGVVLWFAFQAFENIGMNLGIMPVTGVPLPFVSYGGTSMFAAWIGVGLLQSVHLRSRR